MDGSHLERLVQLLDAPADQTAGTSVRLPTNLRDAAVIAVELGYAVTTTELTVKGLRDVLDAVARHATLEAHFDQYPEDRPTLGEMALAASELDGLALPRDLIEQAAQWAARERSGATADDVLLLATGMTLSGRVS